jgi:hypothetical protein
VFLNGTLIAVFALPHARPVKSGTNTVAQCFPLFP